MSIALFDLDNTLIAGDSDYLWGEFLTGIGAVPADSHREANQRFFDDYLNDTLDVDEFLRFQLAPLRDNATATLLRWRAEFTASWIAPIVLPRARRLVDEHRDAGDVLAIATSTNSFITEPIAALLGIGHLLATTPSVEDGRFTGSVDGVPCSGPGKVVKVQAWLGAHGLDLDGSYFYTDSIQDLPLLEAVEHPCAVDPDERLLAEATRHDWPVLSLR